MQEIQEVEAEHVSWTSWSMRKRLLRSLDSRWSDRGDGIKRLFVLPLSILCHSPLSINAYFFSSWPHSFTTFTFPPAPCASGSLRFSFSLRIFLGRSHLNFPFVLILINVFLVFCNFILFSLIINYIIMFCLQGDPSRLIKSDHAVHK